MKVRVGETESATIKTLSVEVRALVIGKKQVTQSVFRQLPGGQIIDHATGQLKGTPWGRVRYPSGDWRGVYVVWQKGGTLYRSGLDPDLGDEARSYVCDIKVRARYIANLGFLLAARSSKPNFNNSWDSNKYTAGGWGYRRPYGEDEFDCSRVLHECWCEKVGAYFDERRNEAQKHLSQEIWRYSSTLSKVLWRINPDKQYQDELRRLYREEVERAEAVTRNWKARFEELSALDQLFIAV